MELFGLVDIPLWLIMLVSAVLLFYIYGIYPYNVWKNLGVPGPPPSPLFGNIPELFDEKIGVRASTSKWQSQYGRIIGMYMFRKPVLLVLDPEALKEIFVKDFNNYTDRFMIGDGLLQQRIIKKGLFFEDGMDWKRIRRIMTPTFSSGKLKALTGHINKTARVLGNTLEKHARLNEVALAKTVFAAFSFDVMTGTAFGLDTDSHKDRDGLFLKHARSLLTFGKIVKLKMTIAGLCPPFAQILNWMGVGFFNGSDVNFFRKNLFSMISQRKKQPMKETDFLQLLLNAEDDSNEDFVGEKKLTVEEIVAQGIIFILAGYETTSTLLQFLSYELALHPDIQERLFTEIQEVVGDEDEVTYEHCQQLKFMDAVIQEALRMYPPSHILTRQAEKECTLMGFTVPAMAGIVIPLYNIGRDSEFFTEPNIFDPDRFLDERKKEMNPCTLLAFGFGPRHCIGMRLAMLQIKVALVHTLRKVIIENVTPEVLDLEDYTGILLPREPIQLTLKAI